VQSGAGGRGERSRQGIRAAGAKIVPGPQDFSLADIVLKVRVPGLRRWASTSAADPRGLLNPYDRATMESYATAGLTCLRHGMAARARRARKAMDVLSSQANIGGYKAVILAANEYGRFKPMLMTAAGTVKSRALLLVLGAWRRGGLQAIATAKRLGAVIEASDVRPAVKEQIESLGAKFLDVPYLYRRGARKSRRASAATRGPMPIDWMRRQAELVHERAKAADIVITTALIPGRPPRCSERGNRARDEAGLGGRRHGDRAGGNCPLTERDRIVVKHGVKLVGISNLPALVAADASALYARNLLNFLKPARRSQDRRA